VMRTAAAVVRPYGAWYQHSVPTHPSPQRIGVVRWGDGSDG